MKAFFLDNTADIMSPEAEAVPIGADAWGIVDIPGEQEAGISIYIDLGPLGYEVDLTVAEVLQLLARATGTKGGPSVVRTRPEVNRIEVVPLQDYEEPCSCGDDTCGNVEDLV